MSVSGVSSNTFMQYARRIGRVYLDMNFGTGSEAFESSIRSSIFKNRPADAPWYRPYKGVSWNDFSSGFGTKMKDAFKAVEQHEAGIRAANGGSSLKALWNSFTSIPKVISEEIKSGQTAAKIASKSEFLGGLKGFGKGLMKKMPLIGGLIGVCFQLPHIVSAFKEGGLVTGLLETGRGVLQIGADMAGFIVGQALIPIPFVGGLIGSMVLGNLCSSIIGQGYNDRKISTEQLQENPNASQTGGLNFHIPFTAQADGINMPSTPLPQPTMSAEKIMQLQMALQNPNAFVYNG